MELNFTKGDGLIPAVIQDFKTRKVLMLGFMNAEAYAQTRSSGRVTFFSRSKGRLWTKGESSGNYLDVKQVFVDCDQDTVLILAAPHGPVCHTGAQDCFGQPSDATGFIYALEQVIGLRASASAKESYTASLLEKGIQKVAQKVGEEAVELILEAQSGPDDLFLGEAADLVYHLLVLLKARGLGLGDVERVLQARG